MNRRFVYFYGGKLDKDTKKLIVLSVNEYLMYKTILGKYVFVFI